MKKRVEKHIKCKCFRVPGLTEWFGEYENDVNKMPLPLEQRVRQCSPPPSP